MTRMTARGTWTSRCCVTGTPLPATSNIRSRRVRLGVRGGSHGKATSSSSSATWVIAARTHGCGSIRRMVNCVGAGRVTTLLVAPTQVMTPEDSMTRCGRLRSGKHVMIESSLLSRERSSRTEPTPIGGRERRHGPAKPPAETKPRIGKTQIGRDTSRSFGPSPVSKVVGIPAVDVFGQDRDERREFTMRVQQPAS